MKISELLNAVERAHRSGRLSEASGDRGGPMKSRLPIAPRAASIDDRENDGGDDGDDDTPVNAEREFKQDAVSLGDGLYALSAWVYPEAWSGEGYSDMLMHRISNLAEELDADIGDYEGISGQTIADDRALAIVFYNSHTSVMFRLDASGARGSGSVEFTPSLMDLQQGGLITNSQMSKLSGVERTVAAWCDAVPETAAVDDAGGRPNTRAWKNAESAVLKLFTFTDPGLGGDDAASDPESSEFWSGVSNPEMSADEKKADDEWMKELIARKMAEKKAKETQKASGPGRDKRK